MTPLRHIRWPAVALALTACTHLWDVSQMQDLATMVDAPTVIDAQGTMGTGSVTSVMRQRWKNSYADTKALAEIEELATGRPLIAGNKVTLLYDGPQTMAAMSVAIANAKDHINLETYIFDQDVVGVAFAESLIAKRKAGVAVQIIYDSVGTIGTPVAFFQNMRDAGIALVEFNPVNPLRLTAGWDPNHRDHRKLLVVDGVIGFTGGVNISSTYANSSLFRSKARRSSQVGWRDTHIQIEGPAVAALQWEFLNSWSSQQLLPLTDSNFFPKLHSVGNKLVRVLASEPGGAQEIYKAYVLAIAAAKKSVHITGSYLVPDEQLLRALGDAAARGVEVKIILPGVKESGVAYYASHSFFQEMLDSGIRLFLLQGSVLHAKTAVIDRVWSTVGSTNMDNRSFLHNHELNVVVFDEAFGTAMDAAFEEDLALTDEVTLPEWEKRPWWERVKEWSARRFAYWL